MGDTVDYGEWLSGVRAQGLLYAGSSFGVKLGMSLGGAASAWILSATNYVPGAVQTTEALSGIAFNFIWAPIISFAFGAVVLLFYKIDNQMPQILEDLDVRRKQTA